MEEMFMLRKLTLVQEIRRFDGSMASKVVKLNALRNAVAHSFVPANRREFRKTRKVTYNGVDIYTPRGLEAYGKDMYTLHNYLFVQAFGKTLVDAGFEQVS
jgi:hypothetical protein